MPERIFGVPAWAAIGTLVGAGVVGYLIFFRGQGGGSSSSGSTYSAQGLAVMQNPDESATMSAQNQLLSELAVNQQAGFQSLSGQVGQVGTDVTNGFSSVGTSLGSIQGQLGTVSNQVSTVSNQVSGVSNQVGQVSGQIGQLSAADTAYYSALQNALASLGASLAASDNALGQQMGAYYNGLAQQLGNVQAGTATLDAGLQQQLNNIGSFLGWQWYQLPNRYTPFLPTSSLNVSQN